MKSREREAYLPGFAETLHESADAGRSSCLQASFLILALSFSIVLFLFPLLCSVLSVLLTLSLYVLQLVPPVFVSVRALPLHFFLWFSPPASPARLWICAFCFVFFPPLCSASPFCWGLSLAFIKPEKVLCPDLQKWLASWRREIVASGMASWV